MQYRGQHTVLSLYWNTTEVSYGSKSFFLYGDTFKHVHDGIIIAEDAFVGYSTKYRIYAKEFKNLNLPPNPCASPEEVVTCINNCIEKQLLKNVTCRFPFINSTLLDECISIKQTVISFWKAWDTIINIAKHSYGCHCKRKCNESGVHFVGSNLSQSEKSLSRARF
uniref:Uncharacterized protein n=1 Tax=Strigamia maritima TaxID=126957 RepID=T1IXI6_STRMM